MSDDQLAPFSLDNATKLREKHPVGNNAGRPLPPHPAVDPLQVSEDVVRDAIRSFPAGSAGGPDGFRPQHMTDLINNQESGRVLLTGVTAFVNCLLRCHCPIEVRKIIFGGKLLALNKKDGGIRPIAVGYYWRRLAAKCATSFAVINSVNYFGNIQLGVGVKGGCEAAIHATRRFVLAMPDDHIIVKLDFKNAFNCIHRDVLCS